MAEAQAIAAHIADRTVKAGDHGAIYALLAAPVEQFKKLEPEEQHEVRDALDAFVRAYAFLSQVVEFEDVGLEALYLASRALAAELPSDGGGRLDLGTEVQLTHLRIEQTSSGSITPDGGYGPIEAIYSGQGKQVAEEKAHLSTIIEVLNERFGTVLGTADQLFFDQLEETWMADDHLVAQAQANPIESFRLVFQPQFLKSIVGRIDDNEEIFRRVVDDPDFQTAVMNHYLARVFERARSVGPEA